MTNGCLTESLRKRTRNSGVEIKRRIEPRGVVNRSRNREFASPSSPGVHQAAAAKAINPDSWVL